VQEDGPVERVQSGRKSKGVAVAVALQTEVLELSGAMEPIGRELHLRENEAFLLRRGFERGCNQVRGWGEEIEGSTQAVAV
jgi:hypothetical protein